MINPDGSGGSVHDPASVLPAPMWERQLRPSNQACENCRGNPDVTRRKTEKMALPVPVGPGRGVYLICRRCDGFPGKISP